MTVGTTGNDSLVGGATADTLDGIDGNDTLRGNAGDDSLNGGLGNDSVYGDAGNDLMIGEDGTDYLYDAASGNDIFGGGAGNDTLVSYYGIDTVNYDLGGGYDRVTLYYTAVGDGAVLELGAGLLPGAVTLHHTNATDDLILRFNGNDQIGIETWFSSSSVRQFSEIRFDDGTVWTWTAGSMQAMPVSTLGTAGNDSMNGTSTHDVIEGFDGNDTIYGNLGNDVLIGAAGNDSMIGHAGNDQLSGGDGTDYLSDNTNGSDTFNGGAGNDTIVSYYGIDTVNYDFGGGYDKVTLYYTAVGDGAVLELGAGLLPGDVTLHHTNATDDLILRFNGSDQIGIETWFSSSSIRQFSEIRFDDGTVWTWAANLQAMSASTLGTIGNDSMNGTATNDVIDGFDGNDTMYGNVGNDVLNGAAGNDSMIGHAGNDQLLGGDGTDYLSDTTNGSDTFNGGAGNDTLFSYYGTDTVNYDLGGGYDKVTLYYTAVGDGAVLELGAGLLPGDVTLHHTNGTDDLILRFNGSDQIGIETWFSSSSIRQFSEVRFDDGTVWTWAANMQGMSASTLGTIGNDSMNGTATNDVIDGFDGNDTIYGNLGNDVLNGAAGNDSMIGHAGNDQLSGGDGTDYLSDTSSGNDSFNGGAGNDTLISYYGIDTVNYDLGGGYDKVTLYYTAVGDGAVLELGAGLLPGDVTLHHTNATDDLILRFNGSDQIGIETWFYTSNNRQFSEIRFDDGTVWTPASMLGMQVSTLGTIGNDYMSVTTANDLVDGLDGNDTLYGNAGHDTLNGGAGNDTIYSHAGDDSLLGGGGNDFLNDTSSGNDTFAGGAGNDTLSAYYGNDIVRFGVGGGYDNVDIFSYAADISVLDLAAGISAASVTLSHTIGSYDLVLNINATDKVDVTNWFYSADYQFDEIRFNDGTVWNWQPGNMRDLTVSTTGTIGNDHTSISGTHDLVDGLAGNDSLHGNDGNDTLIGGAGNDSLYGGTGNDSMLGGGGNDYLNDSGNGNDLIDGGIGNDTIYSSVGNDVIQFGVGGGIDNVSVYYANLAEGAVLQFGSGLLASAVTLHHTNGTDNLILRFSDTDQVVIADWFYSANYRLDEIRFDDGTVWTWTAGSLLDMQVNTAGTAAGEYMYMTESRDSVDGLNGADYILGYGGNDTLNGGLGTDTIDGSAGNDSINGGADDDTLYGNLGNDILVGGSGNNSMRGGAGDDIFIVSNATDIVFEYVSEGIDTVQASVNHALVVDVEHLVLTGIVGLAGTGNLLANSITGTLGNDTLDGSAGADTLSGGAGADSYFIDVAGDVVAETADADIDTVNSLLAYTLGSNLENLTLLGIAVIDGRGNTLDNRLLGNSANNLLFGVSGNDTLTGKAGNDTLNGGTGNDSLAGGQGDDIYYVDTSADLIYEAANEGVDLVSSTAGRTLGANFENLELTGTENITGAGNSLANNLTGNSGNNDLDGKAGNDSIKGAAGDDTLNGGDGVDTLIGGSGDDVYVISQTGEKIVEAEGAGIDTVLSSVSFSLTGMAAEIEHLTLRGTVALSGTGNAVGNALIGNEVANFLEGKGGNDTLTGGTGNDTLSGGTGNDLLIGEVGTDRFLFNAALSATTNLDTVSGIETTDAFQLENAVFTALVAGTLAGGRFVVGTAALDAGDRIVYDQTSGTLYYDADGIGATAQVAFAVVENKEALVASQFLVV